MNLRGAHHADHRFRDGCLTGLGQSSRHGNGIPLSWLSRCQESNLIRRFIRALHRPPCSTSLSCAEGARFERAPGCSVPDHGLAARCLAWLGQPSKFVCPWQELNLQTRCGRAGLGRVRLPVPPQGPCCQSRVRTSVGQSAVSVPAGPTGIRGLCCRLPVQGSNLGWRIQSPSCCRLHQPGMWCPYQDLNLDWTRSERVASAVGLQGRRRTGRYGDRMRPRASSGTRTRSSRLRDGCSVLLS